MRTFSTVQFREVHMNFDKAYESVYILLKSGRERFSISRETVLPTYDMIYNKDESPYVNSPFFISMELISTRRVNVELIEPQYSTHLCYSTTWYKCVYCNILYSSSYQYAVINSHYYPAIMHDRLPYNHKDAMVPPSY